MPETGTQMASTVAIVDSWGLYERWNNAVAAAVYPELPDAVPTYLDLEERAIAAIAAEADYDGDGSEGLQTAVRGVTVAGGTCSLASLRTRHRTWRASGRAEPPPSLAFLALTVLAAEAMGDSADGFDPNNYYSRLSRLLGLPPDSTSVRHEYMRSAELFWADLNRWLEDLEGLRGTPTAYALTFRFVGLPLSQALVREGDRRKFPQFFAQYGLAAGMELAPEVLERYLDAWFASENCPASVSLRRLWKKASARERIATVAAVELVGWDGSLERADLAGLPFQRVRLMAQLRHGFLGSSLDIALTVRALGESFDGRMQVESAAGSWLPLALSPSASNLWRTNVTGGLDVASMLEGVVRLRSESGDQDLSHHPRSIVPLVFDELQSAYVEQERLQLNVDSMLLLRTEAKGKPFAPDIVALLESCARPGFAVDTKVQGLPEGWWLVTGVQLFGAPNSLRYNELIPLARDQLTLAGGLRIPSRVRKWSVCAAPEIRAAVDSADRLRLDLVNVEDEQTLKFWSTNSGALVIDLADQHLPVGDYRVSLFAGGSKSPLQQATVRLRSADDVDPSWVLTARLVYNLDGPRGPAGVLRASEHSEGITRFVDGADVAGRHAVDDLLHAPTEPMWSSPRPSVITIAPIQVGMPDPKSCVVTGAHKLKFPTSHGGRPPKYLDGVCEFCGLVKRIPGWPPKRQSTAPGSTAPQVDVHALPRVAAGSNQLWDAALDALMHLGGGGATTLTGIGSQIDGGALFTAAFPKRLEALGHIAVERTDHDELLRWEISPACLVAVPEGLALSGFWPRSQVDRAIELLSPLGGSLEVTSYVDQPSLTYISGVSATEASDALADMAAVVPEVTESMLEVLPVFSEVAAILSREPMVGFDQAERFDPHSATWTQTSDVSIPGSYRLVRGFERLYVYRTERDVRERTAARGSVYLVKHLTANSLGGSLASYLAERRAVIVPRGCDLPGLYGRALVMATGRLPHEAALTIGTAKRNCLVYDGITRQQADLLVTLLSR